MKNELSTSWVLPEPMQIDIGAGRTPEDIDDRSKLAGKVARIGEQKGWNKSEVAQRIGMPMASFSQWFNGNYGGRFDRANLKVTQWIASLSDSEAVEQALPPAPEFFETRLAREIFDAANIAREMPTICIVTAEAGMGKTMAALHYHENHANTFFMTASPHMRSTHMALIGLAEASNVDSPTGFGLVRKIGQRIQKYAAPTLLIVDEAQNLRDEAINQFRHFTDRPYQCGLLLLGNSESYRRSTSWSQGIKSGQLHRRIFRRVNRNLPDKRDLSDFIRACGITDKDMVNYLTAIGNKPGTLGQVDFTLRLAKLLAMGEQAQLTLTHLKKAWRKRDVGGVDA